MKIDLVMPDSCNAMSPSGEPAHTRTLIQESRFYLPPSLSVLVAAVRSNVENLHAEIRYPNVDSCNLKNEVDI